MKFLVGVTIKRAKNYRHRSMVELGQKKYDCVIWGGYAQGNTGDELCLAAALKRASCEFGPAIAVLSCNPEYTSQLFPDAPVIPFVRPGQSKPQPGFDPDGEWKQCLHSAQRLYLAGGGYLTDLWSLDFVMPPLEFAVQLKLPVFTAPIGLGPFNSKVSAERVVPVLRKADLKVRDDVSQDFCRTHGLQAALEPDDAFALIANWPSAAIEKQPGQHRRKIGVCIFQQYGQAASVDLSDWWTQCLRGLQRQHPEYEIEGFCFHTSLSAEFCEMQRLFPRAGLPVEQVLAPQLDFRKATAAIREYDFIISTRFHAVVAANVFKIPNIAIAVGDYYLAKMKAAVCGYENLSTFINPDQSSPETLLAICKHELAKQTVGN